MWSSIVRNEIINEGYWWRSGLIIMSKNVKKERKKGIEREKEKESWVWDWSKTIQLIQTGVITIPKFKLSPTTVRKANIKQHIEKKNQNVFRPWSFKIYNIL